MTDSQVAGMLKDVEILERYMGCGQFWTKWTELDKWSSNPSRAIFLPKEHAYPLGMFDKLPALLLPGDVAPGDNGRC